MTRTKFSLLLTALISALACLHVCADVRLPALFGDNMVLQQGARTPVWGWADNGEQVTVTFRDQTVKAATVNGRWSAHLTHLKPGDPATLTVAGKNTVEVQRVLVGEVWVCSGQSNMEWPLNKTADSGPAIAASANPDIRLFTVPKLAAETPQTDVKGSWQLCDPQTTPGFSAVGYYFGRALQRDRNVPIGLINTSWGGSPAEVWVSEKALAANKEFKRDILEKYQAAQKKYLTEKAGFDAEKAADPGTTNQPPRAPFWIPASLYNGMIAPLQPFAIAGAIWYQGESNAGRAEQYRRLMPALIRDWRKGWGEGFTFLMVQLAPFKAIQPLPGDSEWAELREAQLLTAEKLPKTGIAVITDLGDEKDIHPQKKREVGERLALAARGIAYGEKIEYSGPIYRGFSRRRDTIVLKFNHVGLGLEARGGELTGFTMCAPERQFILAQAVIDGDTIVVSSPGITVPEAVRFGWADFPTGNLWNKDGLPASPFRTDDFPMVTDGKK